MVKIVKLVKIARLLVIAWLAKMSPCLAMRFGLFGIMGATVQNTPNKGLPLGIALAIDAVRKA